MAMQTINTMLTPPPACPPTYPLDKRTPNLIYLILSSLSMWFDIDKYINSVSMYAYIIPIHHPYIPNDENTQLLSI